MVYRLIASATFSKVLQEKDKLNLDLVCLQREMKGIYLTNERTENLKW